MIIFLIKLKKIFIKFNYCMLNIYFKFEFFLLICKRDIEFIFFCKEGLCKLFFFFVNKLLIELYF